MRCKAITADRLTISKGKDGVMPSIALVGGRLRWPLGSQYP